jgi:GNAT superfamily N-acetyltransferase
MSRHRDAGVTTVEVVVTFLERSLSGNEAARELPFTLELVAPSAAATVSEAMYRAVGEPWQWTDRLGWTTEQWAESVNRAGVEVWIARVQGDVAGYFELHAEPDAVELKYFGLLPGQTGRGLGGALLDAAITRADTFHKRRMTLNTCTLDHPAALPNYLKRGFRVVRTEFRRRTLP